MTAADVKVFFRTVIKVVAGGPAVGTPGQNRAAGMLAALDKLVDFLVELVATTYTTLPPSTAIAVDFTAPAQLVSLSDNATFTTSARAQGRTVRLFLANATGADVTLTFPAGWIWYGTMPTKLAAGKRAVLTLECVYGAAESDLVAGYAAQA